MKELSKREDSVYKVITTTSLTRKEIATKLFMHYSNVEYVEKRIYAKLGIPNRIALIFAKHEAEMVEAQVINASVIDELEKDYKP